jgi:hypothetical protein
MPRLDLRSAAAFLERLVLVAASQQPETQAEANRRWVRSTIPLERFGDRAVVEIQPPDERSVEPAHVLLLMETVVSLIPYTQCRSEV